MYPFPMQYEENELISANESMVDFETRVKEELGLITYGPVANDHWDNYIYINEKGKK